MAINETEAFGLEPFGVVGKDDNGNVIWYLTGGSGSPVGTQAPLSTIYSDSTNGKVYIKSGANSDDWQLIGDSFANAADFENAFDDTLSQTTSNDYVNKLTFLTGPKEGGRYIVQWSFEAGQSKGQRQLGTRVQLNDTIGTETLTEITNGLSADNQFELRSGFRILDNLPASLTGYTITVDFGLTVSGGIAQIRNVGVLIYRIGD